MVTLMIINTTHGGMFFSLTYVAAFLVAAGMMINEGFRKGYPGSAWLLIILTGVIFFIIGDKVFTYSQEQWVQVFTRFHFPEADKKTVLGGIVGLFTGMFLAKTWLRFNRPVLDTLAVALPLGMSISRIGCLMAGCCFGTSTNLPWGIQYDAASWAYQVHQAQGLLHLHDETSLAVHPAQLYQVIGCLIIAFLVWRTRKQWKSNGSLFLFSVLCYAVLRFFVEFVRAPESNFFAGQFFGGLKILQWLIMGAILLGLFILILRESKAKTISAVSRLVHLSDLRQVVLTILLSIIVFYSRKWFDPLELSTILLFLIPVIIILSVKIYRRYSVAGFRWVIPVVLVCSFSFMAQKRNPSLKQGEKITFTEIGISGLVGKYSEELQRVHRSCGPPSHQTLTQQSVPFYQTGLNLSYNIWQGKYTKYTFGGRLFYGDEFPEQTTISSGTGPIFGISPYVSMNWHWFGFSTGFSLGQMKIPIGKPESKQYDGDIISKDHSWVTIIPSLGIRLGPSDELYAEANFPGFFPSSTPFPTFQAGIGTGLGKTNGTKVGIGYCYNGIYAQVVYPIQNKLVLSAFYADNLSTGNEASRIFSFGINYRFSIKKTTLDTLKHKVSSRFYTHLPFSKLGAIVLDIDGNVYHTMALRGQVWMAENLMVTRFRDGSEIPDLTNDVPGSGRLYNWAAVNDSKNLCPTGWHVPSLDEWAYLFKSLGKHRPARKLEYGFSSKGKVSQWWSSTEQDTLHAQSLYLNNQTIGIMFTSSAKTSGLSVRCIRDY